MQFSNPKIIFTNDFIDALSPLTSNIPGGIAVISDSNVDPLSRHILPEAPRIVIPAGEDAKSFDTLQAILAQLAQLNITRKGLLINIGGGVLTDIAGFASAIYLRGIPFINIPTTLLAAVDASIGGKTAIDFLGRKNAVGAFAMPRATIISDSWLTSLPKKEILSGFAEMIKHALLVGSPIPENIPPTLDQIKQSVDVKQHFVDIDPLEKGPRKALNLGHTFGHALEELALQKDPKNPIPHGFAVAWGLVVSLVISKIHLHIDDLPLYNLAQTVRNLYGPLPLTCDQYPAILKNIAHDKKNSTSSSPIFTLLNPKAPNRCSFQTVPPETITTAIDIARDLTTQ